MLLAKLKVTACAVFIMAALSTGVGSVVYRNGDGPSANSGECVSQCGLPVSIPVTPALPEPKAPVASDAQCAEPIPEPKAKPDTCAPTPKTTEKRTTKVISIQTIIVQHGVDLKSLDPHLKKLIDLQSLHKVVQKSAAGVLLVRRQSGPGTCQDTIEIHELPKEKGRVIIGVPVTPPVSGKWVPAGKPLSYTVWTHADGKSQACAVAVTAGNVQQGAMTAVGSQIHVPVGVFHAASPGCTWVVIGSGKVRVMTPGESPTVPVSPDHAGFLVGPLAP